MHVACSSMEKHRLLRRRHLTRRYEAEMSIKQLCIVTFCFQKNTVERLMTLADVRADVIIEQTRRDALPSYMRLLSCDIQKVSFVTFF